MTKNKENDKVKRINQFLRVNKMTPDRLRTFSGFENYTDNQAEDTIEELEKFANIIVRHVMMIQD